jgi:hypothetical protein
MDGVGRAAVPHRPRRMGRTRSWPGARHAGSLRVPSAMTLEQRLRKAFELGATARALFEHGLRQRFPGMEDAAFRRLRDGHESHQDP